MVQQDPDILAVAEALLGSSSSYQHNVGFSINQSMDHVGSEDLVTGSRADGKMSVVRRFFCLFVTFDLLFIILMWLICLMLTGDDVFSSLSKQVVHYSIQTSLFDIVMVAACRFVILLLFYALLYISHWYIIAITTAGTCAFLIAKVFIYDWPKAQSPVFQVLLILISFVLAWSEAWFLDFRVLPQETQAASFVRGAGIGARTSERSPLLRSFLQTVSHINAAESTRSFYSPLESPRLSDDEGEEIEQTKELTEHLQKFQYDEYRLQAQDIVESALRILNNPEWKLEKETVEGDAIHSRKVRGTKMYRMTGTVDLSPRQMLDLIYYKIEEQPSWNPTVLQCQRVEIIDDQTDILYQVTAEAGGGIVSSRDFINLRHWVLVDDCYITALAAINHSNYPPQKKFTRGEHGPSCWVLRPIEGDPSRCAFEWLLNTNLKGWLPQSVVDTAFGQAMRDYMRNLRTYVRRRTEYRILP